MNIFSFFIVYYPEVPMLGQPLEMKIDEELRNNVSSSLANIGTDEKEGKYDTAFEDTKRNTNEEHKTSSSETEKEEGNNDNMLLDGDATPKVSRVRFLWFNKSILINCIFILRKKAYQNPRHYIIELNCKTISM